MSAKIEVPTNDDAGDGRDHGHGRGLDVLAHPPGDVPDDDEGQRPAPGDVVGRRGEVERDAGDEAEHGRELRAAGERGADHDQQAEVGDDAVPGEVREQRHLEHQREADDERRDRQPQGAHRRLPSASITDRSLLEPDGTTTPTRSSDPKSTNGSITARCEVSRRLL